jgi:hypothetical protein
MPKKPKSEVETQDLQPGFVTAKGSVSVKSSKKEILKMENEYKCQKAQVHKVPLIASSDPSSPVGIKWDGENYSCAYDSLFVVLFDIWSTDSRLWTERSRKLIRRISSHCL